jgi:hypothetical protein
MFHLNISAYNYPALNFFAIAKYGASLQVFPELLCVKIIRIMFFKKVFVLGLNVVCLCSVCVSGNIHMDIRAILGVILYE